jgi:hypothetical protein
MVIEPPAGIPRVNSEVLVVSDDVPVPVAGEEELAALDWLEVPEEPELEADEDAVEALADGNVESPRDCSALCTAAESSELTRFKAVSLAMLERPFDRLVSADPMTLISVSSAVEA